MARYVHLDVSASARSRKHIRIAVMPMNGKDRLELMHGMFHMDEQIPFHFSWDWLPRTGLSVKDFIAPSSFEFRNGNTFGMGKKLGCVSFLQILAPELNDRMLADFLDMESSLVVTMHVQSVDQVSAIKTIKRKITDIQKMTIEEQKKAVRSGYDMDIIPSDLATYGEEAKKLLQELPIHHNDVVGQSVEAAVQGLLAGLEQFHGGKGNEDRHAGGGQPPLDLNLIQANG